MKINILIVEDEIIIANLLLYHLEQAGHSCVGIAVDYNEAILILDSNKIDLVLLDINLSGNKNGIDLGLVLYNFYKIPIIYISSYSDKQTIDELKNTYPEGYFIKPINHENLLIKIELMFHKNEIIDLTNYKIQIGKDFFFININELIFIKADHVYVELEFINDKLLFRTSLKSILELLPSSLFLQANRSIAINHKFIVKVSNNTVYTKKQEFNITLAYKYNFDKFIKD